MTSIAYLIPNTTARVTSVVLIAPSSDTHTFNMHQRIVELEVSNCHTAVIQPCRASTLQRFRHAGADEHRSETNSSYCSWCGC